MARKLLCLAALAMLGACGEGKDAGRHRPPPRPVERPFADWLKAEPDCRGSMRRGEWLACDDPDINALHRALAAQWEAERQDAGRQRLFIQRQQLQALLSERAACEDAECVASAYRRYLAAEPEPLPTPEPAVAIRPKPQPVRHARGPRWNWRDNAPACSAQIGWTGAAALARQCSAVNPGEGRECSPIRSCSALRTMVLDGCWDSKRKPGFCTREGRHRRD